MNFGYIAYSALWSPEPISIQRLKLATLLFDRLVFAFALSEDLVGRTISVYGDNEPLPQMTRKTLEQCWVSCTHYAPRFSIDGIRNQWPWDHAPQALRTATRSVLTELRTDEEPEDDTYELYKLGGYLMSDIMYWRVYFGSATFVGDSLTENIVEHWSFSEATAASEYQTTCLSCPDMLSISWKDIVELRESPFLANFRAKYPKLSKLKDSSHLFEEYLRALEKLVEVIKPRPGVEAVKGVLGNLPLAPMNPIGISSSIRDTWKSHRLKKEYGWVFFLHDLRSRQMKATTPNPVGRADS